MLLQFPAKREKIKMKTEKYKELDGLKQAKERSSSESAAVVLSSRPDKDEPALVDVMDAVIFIFRIVSLAASDLDDRSCTSLIFALFGVAAIEFFRLSFPFFFFVVGFFLPPPPGDSVLAFARASSTIWSI